MEMSERDLYVIDNRLKITQQSRIYEEEIITINGVETLVRPGYQHIFILYQTNYDKEPTKFRQITFFTKTMEEDEEFFSLRNIYITTLCKSLAQPLSKFIEKLSTDVAIQA